MSERAVRRFMECRTHYVARADRKLIVVCLESDWLFARDIENGGLARSGVPCLCDKRLLSAWSRSNSFL